MLWLGRIACTRCIRCGLLLQTESVCRFISHVREPCKIGWTDRDAVRGAYSYESKEPCIRWGLRSDESICSSDGRQSAMRPFAKLHWTLVLKFTGTLLLAIKHCDVPRSWLFRRDPDRIRWRQSERMCLSLQSAWNHLNYAPLALYDLVIFSQV